MTEIGDGPRHGGVTGADDSVETSEEVVARTWGEMVDDGDSFVVVDCFGSTVVETRNDEVGMGVRVFDEVGVIITSVGDCFSSGTRFAMTDGSGVREA